VLNYLSTIFFNSILDYLLGLDKFNISSWKVFSISVGKYSAFPLESIQHFRWKVFSISVGKYSAFPLESIQHFRWKVFSISVGKYSAFPYLNLCAYFC